MKMAGANMDDIRPGQVAIAIGRGWALAEVSNGGSYRRWASPHLCRWLVLPLAEIHDLSQQPILSPCQIAHLNHHLRSHPMHSRQHERRSEPAATRRSFGERHLVHRERFELPPKPLQ